MRGCCLTFAYAWTKMVILTRATFLIRVKDPEVIDHLYYYITLLFYESVSF
jgi:hypothetical protein